MIKNINMKIRGMFRFAVYTLLPLVGGAWAGVSCQDFFDQESDHVIYAEKDHLGSASDTLYSMTGVLQKLQALGDRTILLGELRGDLMDLTSVADKDLREVAQFKVSKDNAYNRPLDYYAVINNCNYFIEHVDTSMLNSLKEYVFMREYAAVKGIRAWTYLQLVLNYGKVPFVDKPILTKDASEATYPTYDLMAVCDYFINDLQQLADNDSYVNETFDVTRETPMYGEMLGIDSRFFYFPLNILLGDLYLWRATETGNKSDYKEAARRYYTYISRRNGNNSAYYTGIYQKCWTPGSTSYLGYVDSYSPNLFSSNREKGYGANSELITLIPGDSLQSDPNYSRLRGLMQTTMTNNSDFMVSLVPSQGLREISAAQVYCNPGTNGLKSSTTYAPQGLSNNRTGDLRFSSWFTESQNATYTVTVSGTSQTQRIDLYQTVNKYRTGNVSVMRRSTVYLRLAEALNGAGYPHMAFEVLSVGLNNDSIAKRVLPYYPTLGDTTFIREFQFPNTRYIPVIADYYGTKGQAPVPNTLGIHSRGSGFTPFNDFYCMPNDTIEPNATKRAQLQSEQQAFVDSLLLNEGALELAWEGTRYFDIMRYALRQVNPGKTMQDIIGARKGKANSASTLGELNSLLDKRNWYLEWDGKIGWKE